ncbi:MAG TPA: hypothetical protein VFT42_03050 [Solirubrobacteraceae bacterium]|nr:hypothetical protein [Solirubrobacteraceae bacterium]
MDERPRDPLHRLIAAIARRSDAEAHALASTLAQRCWPVTTADRDEPLARDWLRRWSPRSAPLPPPACSCAHGRCAVCN